jgi:cell shape-determining protein MreC
MRRAVMVTVVVIAVLVILQVFQSSWGGRILQPVAVPLLKLRTGIAQRMPTLVNWFSSRSALITENESLKQQVHLAYQEHIAYEALRQEHQSLRNSLALSVNTSNRIIAPIISKPPFAAYDTLLVARGERDGIRQGARVYADYGLIGTVVEVYGGTSLVELFSKPGTPYEVVAGTSTRLSFEGTGNGTFRARVPQGIAIATGTSVVLPTDPRTAIAVITDITTDPADAFRDVFAETLANLTQIEYVFIDL